MGIGLFIVIVIKATADDHDLKASEGTTCVRRGGAKFVVIDPYRMRTAECADCIPQSIPESMRHWRSG
jgi:anaerobic selenocysteine-containing dehydrogenase